jgi:hypothetical protein
MQFDTGSALPGVCGLCIVCCGACYAGAITRACRFMSAL